MVGPAGREPATSSALDTYAVEPPLVLERHETWPVSFNNPGPSAMVHGTVPISAHSAEPDKC